MLTIAVPRDAMLPGLEEVLVSCPEDVCMHRAYASALIRAGSPAHLARGRFIETQLKLEEPQTPEEKRRLEGRERKLLRDHGAAWLGELAGWLIDRPGWQLRMVRGWVDRIEAPVLDADFLRALTAAPQARMLRQLVIHSSEPAGVQALEALEGTELLAGLKLLAVNGQGENEAPEAVLRRLLGR